MRRIVSLGLLVIALAVPVAPRLARAEVRTSADPVDAGRPAVPSFTDKEGLPQNSVMAMAYDRQRFLWVGTQDGLAVYNGRGWAVQNLPNRTVSNFVRSMII